MAGLLSLPRCQSTTAPSLPVATLTPCLSVPGQVVWIGQAGIGSIQGGVVRSVAVDVGSKVVEEQVIVRIRTSSGTEVFTAPWHGAIDWWTPDVHW